MENSPLGRVSLVCLSRRTLLKGLTGLVGLTVTSGDLSACALSTSSTHTPSSVPALVKTQSTATKQATPRHVPGIVSSGEGIIHLYASFSFDLGKEVKSGADILWTDAPGRYTVWQVDETLLANIGIVDFDAIDLDFLRHLNYSKYRLLDGASGLANGDVFAAATTRGNRVKVLIVNIADNLHIRWVTYRCLC